MVQLNPSWKVGVPLKKISSVALIAVLSVGTIAGCSSGNTDSQPSASATTTTVAKKPPTKFSISYPTTSNAGYHTHNDINNNKWVKKLEEMTNTDLTLSVIDVSKMGLCLQAMKFLML